MEAITTRTATTTTSSRAKARLATPYDLLKSAIADIHPATAEHSIQVRICATSLGIAWGLSGRELTTLAIAAELHDIGKLQIPSSILDKPGTLSVDEWQVVRQHPAWGAEVVASAFRNQPGIALCVMHHHDRIDGSGYPGGLRGTQIPLLCRILAVADAYTSLTEDRSYRAAFGARDALRIMSCEDKGKYDPNVLDVLARWARLEAVS